MAKNPKQTKEPVYYKGEPPVWFQFLMKNGNYDAAVNLDEAGWAKQVESRLSYKSPEKLETYDLSDDDKAKGYSRYKKVRRIQEQGIVESLRASSNDKRPTYKGLTELRLSNHHVEALNQYVVEIQEALSLDDYDHELIREGFDEDPDEEVRVNSSIYVDHDNEVVDFGYLSAILDFKEEVRLFTVDLTIPSSILEDQFKLFIKKKKEELEVVIGESIKIMNGKRNSWINNAVMPFLDLQFWAAENNINLSNEYYAKKIFKLDEIKGGSSVARTTKGVAKEFMEMDSFNLLNRN